jgi:16S rRNA (adenine1518-N6/adenine1519-N6)-dimethyltransferase
LNNEQVTPLNISGLLQKYELRPSKGLGQNFLVDDNALQKIVKVADVTAEDIVLEIGPGLGSLTRYLGLAAKKVIAVELDQRLFPALHETLAQLNNIEIVIGDILEINPANLLLIMETGKVIGAQSDTSTQHDKNPVTPAYKVVANIPYYITSALIRHLLEADTQPSMIVLTVQKEVAQRICEQPPHMSILALSVQVYGEAKIVARIPAGAFYPTPKVDSSVVKIDLYADPFIPKDLILEFFKLVKAGFGQKRKTLRNALSAGTEWSKEQVELLLDDAGINPQRRAQTLSLEEWKVLTITAAQGK